LTKKLACLANDVKAEGWQWVTADPDADYAVFAEFVRMYPEQAKLSRKAQQQMDRLAARYDELAESMSHDEDDSVSAQLQDIERQIEALQPAEIWPAHTLASCGAIITLDRDGDARVVRGLMKRADARKRHEAEEGASPDHPSAPSPYSAKLIEDLTSHKTAVIRAGLTAQPSIALAAVVHGLLVKLWYGVRDRSSCLEFSAKAGALHTTDDTSSLLQALECARQHWAARLPADESEVWHWCLTQSTETLLELLAYLAGATVDAVRHKGDPCDKPHLAHADALAQALRIDMTAWYAPTAEGFFSRISRKTILSVLDEAAGSHGRALEKLGKRDLAERAAQLVQGTRWLPEPLRTGAVPADPPLPAAAE
jgi:ParB family chromosome partitioning protein